MLVFRAIQFVFVCHVSMSHWVIARVLTDEWKVQLFDSLLYKFHTEQLKEHRKVQLIPITHLFLKVL